MFDRSRGRSRLRVLVVGLGLVMAACAPETGIAPQSAAPSTAATPTGAASAAAEPVTISFANWASAETATKDGITKVIEAFQKANPTITVKSVPIAFSDIGRQLLLQNASGNVPDVAEIAGNDGIALAETSALEPLEPLLSKDFQASLVPSLVELGRYKGQFELVPWTSTPFGFWYNRTLMTKAGLDPNSPPRTIDQLRAAMATIRAKLPDVIPLGWDTTNRSFGLDYNWPLMRTFGAEPIADGKAKADTAEMRAYLDFVRELVTKGYTVPNQKLGYFRPLAAQDKVAFTFDGPYLQGTMQATNKTSDADVYKTWGVTALPALSGKSFSSPSDHQLVIFKASKQKAAAARFVEWLVASKESIDAYTIPIESSLPPVKDAAARFDRLNTPVFKSFLSDVVPTVVRPPWGNAYSNGFSTIMAGVQRVISTNDPTAQIATDMQAELTRKLAGN